MAFSPPVLAVLAAGLAYVLVYGEAIREQVAARNEPGDPKGSKGPVAQDDMNDGDTPERTDEPSEGYSPQEQERSVVCSALSTAR
ncbi:MAG: hypothetical protein KAT70_00210 [Thermoplasmata archaeon]|nr:hypothetical protein [Thermoplasmata archaeon]